MTYWSITINLEGSRDRRTPKFKWSTNTRSGEAHVRTMIWSGGSSVGVIGPGISSTRGLTDVDRRGSLELNELPYEVLCDLEAKVSEVIQSTRAGLALVNAAILEKMPEDWSC